MTEKQLSSTVPTVLEDLEQLLKDVVWPARASGVESPVDIRGSAELGSAGREAVLIGQVRGSQEYTAMGARSRDEDFRIEMFVVIRFPGDTALEAALRAWQLFGVLERLFTSAEYIAMGERAGVLWNEFVDLVGTPTAEDEGSGHVIQSHLRVRSRIRPRGTS